jgi:hypothetical protein
MMIEFVDGKRDRPISSTSTQDSNPLSILLSFPIITHTLSFDRDCFVNATEMPGISHGILIKAWNVNLNNEST